ncbi:MAG TPA: type IV toxin-antitoxin system AbiEi family antitoxin [Candidatus Bathyarchaeia archaeon]|nr:type IV toxin-antitoxin system AbiEi family antitoxin [Candidatus Bathyarchaeia archaeon]
MRRVHNIFEPKATRILRALLITPQWNWTIRGLAEEVKISPGYAHAVISTLIDLGHVAHTEHFKIKTVNPTVLLKRWAAYNQYDKINTFLDYYTFEREVNRFIEQLSSIQTPNYALTALAAASLIAPHVRPVDIHIYIKKKEEAPTLAKNLDLQPIPKGGNVKLVIPYDEGVFYGQQTASVRISDKEEKKAKVVCDVQLFVDLYNYPARGLEAAEHLYERIVEKWGKTLVGEQ